MNSIRIHRTAGFTLIEIISVLVIMVLILSISLGGYHAWKQANALSSSEMRVRAFLSMARQNAIATCVPTSFTVLNTVPESKEFGIVTDNELSKAEFDTGDNPAHGCFFVSTTLTGDETDADANRRVVIGDLQILSNGVVWLDGSSTNDVMKSSMTITFRSDGSCLSDDSDGSPVELHMAQNLDESFRTNVSRRAVVKINTMTGSTFVR